MKGKSITFVVCTVLLLIFFISSPLFSAECRDDRWQPTFVRHMSVAPTVFYFTGYTFIPMADHAEAQRTCLRLGVRMPVKRRTCQERQWENFSCGCNMDPAPNSTCAAFLVFLKTYENNALGRVWRVEGEQWKGLWTRLENSKTFEAVWTGSGGVLQRGTLAIEIKGNEVTAVREHQKGNCTYRGVIGSDMETVTGTYRCPGGFVPLPWKAVVER